MIEVTYRQHMGSDLDVVNCARVSFGAVSRAFTGRDARLIAYLAEHGHFSPFAHPQVSFHVKAPIFVRTQCFKHVVGFSPPNEISRRYVDTSPEVYVPDYWRGRPTDGRKQGSAGRLGRPEAARATAALREAYATSLTAYETLLALGVAPEQARMVLPQGMLTEWIWTGSLAAWARFCHLRLSPDAQAETSQVAGLVADKMAELFPISWAALAGWRPSEETEAAA